MSLTLISPAFAQGERIPDKHARDGENLLPPIKWSGVPEGTRSLTLIVEDPDAPRGTFRHLGVFNIPPSWDGLAESADTMNVVDPALPSMISASPAMTARSRQRGTGRITITSSLRHWMCPN